MKNWIGALVFVLAAASAWAQPGPQAQSGGPDGGAQMGGPAQGGPGLGGPAQAGPGMSGSGAQNGPMGPGCGPRSGEWVQDPDIRDSLAKEGKANREVHDLLSQYSKAQGKEKDAARSKLEKAVSALFDLEVAHKELEIKKMEEEVQHYRDQIAKGRQSKEKYVSQRMEQLAGGADTWDW